MELKRCHRSAAKSLDIVFRILWLFLLLGCAASLLLSPPRAINQSSRQRQVEMDPSKKCLSRKDAKNQATSLLVPSQVLHAFPRAIHTSHATSSVSLVKENKSKLGRKSARSASLTTLSLVPSQVIQSYSSSPKNSTSVEKSLVLASASTRRQKARRKKSAHRSNDDPTSGKFYGKRKSQKRMRQRIGDLPDVEWYVRNPLANNLRATWKQRRLPTHGLHVLFLFLFSNKLTKLL